MSALTDQMSDLPCWRQMTSMGPEVNECLLSSGRKLKVGWRRLHLNESIASVVSPIIMSSGGMLNFLALQEFLPHEQKETGRCIWCGEGAPTNRAHIVSKKLTSRAINAPVLKFRVCKACNSLCGELERWILSCTPLLLLRNMLYVGSESSGSSESLSCFYSEAVENWVTFKFNPKNRSYRVDTQLIFRSAHDPLLLTEEPLERHIAAIAEIQSSVRNGSATKKQLPSLPSDFAPRVILLGANKIVAVARAEMEICHAVEEARKIGSTVEDPSRLRLNDCGSERHHLRWSAKNWARFCAKTALEALCLFEGGDVCLKREFDNVREFVRNGTLSRGREAIFDEAGPANDLSVPGPVYLDLTNEQEAPEHGARIIPHADQGSHIVLLYEINGWVIASVVFCGLPSSVLILAGPESHLRDFYLLAYDYDSAEYHFLRLAYDRQRPVISLPVPGDRFTELAHTYNLRAV